MKLIAIVEGHGDVAAVRVLLRRVLHEKLQRYDVVCARNPHTRTSLYFLTDQSVNNQRLEIR